MISKDINLKEKEYRLLVPENKLDATQRAAQLLLEGAKMTNIACPECDMPIYQKRDENLYCATCDKRVVREEEQSQKVAISSSGASDPIAKKIAQLSTQLEAETDLAKIKELSETIRHLQKIQQS